MRSILTCEALKYGEAGMDEFAKGNDDNQVGMREHHEPDDVNHTGMDDEWSEPQEGKRPMRELLNETWVRALSRKTVKRRWTGSLSVSMIEDIRWRRSGFKAKSTGGQSRSFGRSAMVFMVDNSASTEISMKRHDIVFCKSQAVLNGERGSRYHNVD